MLHLPFQDSVRTENKEALTYCKLTSEVKSDQRIKKNIGTLILMESDQRKKKSKRVPNVVLETKKKP